MDVVLELFDTFLFDWVYATLLPSSWLSSLPTMIKSGGGSGYNGTLPELSGLGRPQSIYKPATQYLQLKPSEYAYMSALPRDNMYRQGLTLYLITWYVHISGSRL